MAAPQPLAAIWGTIGDHDVLVCVFKHLDIKDLGRVAPASPFFRPRADADVVWGPLWRQRVAGKLVVRSADPFYKGVDLQKEAVRCALRDSTRSWLTDVELMNLSWFFRFRPAAGQHWLSQDPYLRNQTPARAKFLPCGRMEFEGIEGLETARTEWSWATRGAKRRGPRGSFLRVSLDGAPVPSYVVTRHPNWGFVMQNCWGIFTSFPMEQKAADPHLEEGGLLDLTADQHGEVLRYRLSPWLRCCCRQP
mmetsp:Transcript_41476/g.117458  ORF Transcript_41476/g.117458 Transcript_41476/m.117458 type:complete len:250 (+) Transcript_41476:75-824(+)